MWFFLLFFAQPPVFTPRLHCSCTLRGVVRVGEQLWPFSTFSFFVSSCCPTFWTPPRHSHTSLTVQSLPLSPRHHGGFSPSQARRRRQHRPFVPDHLYLTTHPFRSISLGYCTRRFRICNSRRNSLCSRGVLEDNQRIICIDFHVPELENPLE